MTFVKRHLSPKSLIGPGKLPGLSRNGPPDTKNNGAVSYLGAVKTELRKGAGVLRERA